MSSAVDAAACAVWICAIGENPISIGRAPQHLTGRTNAAVRTGRDSKPDGP
ncbi:MAG: hypothetical protein JWM11_3494 [Planctomycetaceae bacterium]|nr:hypothetical protein [Planctomycetaceae bacterium]